MQVARSKQVDAEAEIGADEMLLAYGIPHALVDQSSSRDRTVQMDRLVLGRNYFPHNRPQNPFFLQKQKTQQEIC